MFQDLPHPVPPLAFLRYKENYFFILLDPEREAFGVAHLNFEPGFNRARFACNLMVRGTLHKYGAETPFPADFEGARELGDGRLRLSIDPDTSTFHLRFDGDGIGCNLRFEPRFPAFDFAACRTAAPETPSFQEAMTLALNLPFDHMQQAMRVTGEVALSGTGEQLAVDGYGYRDHSWCVRSDNLAASHSWCGLNFPDCAFGVMTIETLHRPGLVAREGYVVDGRGARPLRRIEVIAEGELPTGVPERLVHRLQDNEGTDYVITSDIAARFAHVPLFAEKPDGSAVYNIVENFCPSRLDGGGEGISLVEVGYSTPVAGPA